MLADLAGVSDSVISSVWSSYPVPTELFPDSRRIFFDYGSAALHIGNAVANGLEFGFDCCASEVPVEFL
jgi:hypothetical protein